MLYTHKHTYIYINSDLMILKATCLEHSEKMYLFALLYVRIIKPYRD